MTEVALALAMLTLVGLIQCILGLIVVRHFARPRSDEAEQPPTPLPSITILKPLCGAEPLLEQALEYCFNQDYPDFEIIFGIQNPADPALAVVESLRLKYPAREVSVVIDPTLHGPNRKVSNLINMLPSARHEILVISDSDLHVTPNYLRRLVAEMRKPGTGLVTSLYIGVPASRKGWAAALGATQISHHFLPGVLLSRVMGRQDCLGSTAMFRREILNRVGGFESLVHLLAEDNVLGQRVRGLGLSVELADIVPAATVPEPSFGPLWHHEIRWTRTIRELAPASLIAATMQYPLFWSLIAMAVTGFEPWSIILFLGSWGIRAVCAHGIDAALRPYVGRPAFPTPLWLLPLRDALSSIEIAASFWVDEVTWRGHKMGAIAEPLAPVRALAVPLEPERVLQEN